MAGSLNTNALLRLAQLLEARALALDRPTEAAPPLPELAPPPNPLPVLGPALQRLTAAITASSARRQSCLEQLRVLSLAPTELSVTLFSLSQASPTAARQELEGEARALAQHILLLRSQRDRLQERLEQAQSQRLSAAARHASAPSAPSLRVQRAEAPLGPRIAGVLAEALAQAHDLVLAQEQLQPEPAERYWAWKDRLDMAQDRLPEVSDAPSSRGWPTLLDIVRELELVSAEVAETAAD